MLCCKHQRNLCNLCYPLKRLNKSIYNKQSNKFNNLYKQIPNIRPTKESPTKKVHLIWTEERNDFVFFASLASVHCFSLETTYINILNLIKTLTISLGECSVLLGRKSRLYAPGLQIVKKVRKIAQKSSVLCFLFSE